MNFLKKIFGQKTETKTKIENDILPFLNLLQHYAANKSKENYNQVLQVMEAGTYSLLVPVHSDGNVMLFNYQDKKVLHAFTSSDGLRKFSSGKIEQYRLVQTSELFGFCRTNEVYALGINPSLASATVIDMCSITLENEIAKQDNISIAQPASPLPETLRIAFTEIFSKHDAIVEVYHVVITKDGQPMTGIAIQLEQGGREQQDAIRQDFGIVLNKVTGAPTGMLFLDDEALYQSVSTMSDCLIYKREL